MRQRSWIGLHVTIAGAIILVACAGSDSTDGKTESTSPVTSPTSESDAETPPSIATDAPTTTTDVDTVSFENDIQPILESNCASCHSTGGPGAADFVLETAQDAKDNARYIASAAEIGYMPPWPADDGDLPFKGDRRLSDEERFSLTEWLRADAPLDVPSDSAIKATSTSIIPIERDAVMTGAPYKGSTDNPDDYRCQVYDPELTEESFLQGYAVEPDRTEVVHHVLLFRATAGTRADAEAIDAEDEAPGWTCNGATGVPAENDDIKQIVSWAPGQDPTILPADTAISMQPGDYFIAQIHYHYEPESDAFDPDQTAISADFASDEIIAAAGGQLDVIDLTLYIGPAEIPCSTTEIGPLCDREAAQADLIARRGPLAAVSSDGLLAQCGASVEDFEDMTNGTPSSTCDRPATPGQIVSIWGHMHEIGSWFKMTLNPGTADETVLLDIPDWDFDWQLNYSPIDDVVLTDGDVIRVECGWDRSKMPDDAEPRYVLWADGTADEMCYSLIMTRPAEASS